eukprot:g9538.t1
MAAFGPVGPPLDPAVQQMLDHHNRAQIIADLQGTGIADDVQRAHLHACSDELDEPCTDSQCLNMSRALEARDIKRTLSKNSLQIVDWDPWSYTAALFAAGATNAGEARQIHKHLKNALTGSLKGDPEHPGCDKVTVEKKFFDTLKEIFSGDLLPVLVANPAGPGGIPPVETPAQLYARRVRTALRANFWPTFNQNMRWVKEGKVMKESYTAQIAKLEAQRASDKADFANRMNQMKSTAVRKNNNVVAAAAATATFSTSTPGRKGAGKGASVLDSYFDPLNPVRERSPYRANMQEKMICGDYATGNPNAACKDIPKGGKCPKGCHGGSFRRMAYCSAIKNWGLSHEQIRLKTTEYFGCFASKFEVLG